MANIKYFNGSNELHKIREIGGKLFGYVNIEDLYFVAGEGWKGFTAVERAVEFKSNPSRHVCDDRCVNATGRIMKCECSCGGKNHGRGSSIMCEAA
jgi:hypothetical protein